MGQKALQVEDRRVLELVVGMPIVWTDEKLQKEAQKALTVRREVEERNLPQQVLLQENYLRALAFFNQLTEIGVSVKALEGNFEARSLNAELMPPLAVKILHAMSRMPHPIEIQEWAILTPARKVDPHLAFKVAERWYSVHQWP